MAGRIPPEETSQSSQPFRGPFSEPRSQRRAPRQYPASLDTDLSLVAELRRSEEQAAGQRSLPNNLGWSSRGTAQQSPSGTNKKKGKHFEQVKLPAKSSMNSPPSDAVGFTPKRHHTPHTVPRTRFPSGTPMAERLAMESLRQQLSFDEEAEPVDQSSRSRASRTSQNPSSSTANNERTLPTQARTSTSASLPVLEMNETETTRASTEGAINSTNSKVQKIELVRK